MSKEKSTNRRKTTTIQISLKTKEYLDKLKEKEQLSSYDYKKKIIKSIIGKNCLLQDMWVLSTMDVMLWFIL